MLGDSVVWIGVPFLLGTYELNQRVWVCFLELSRVHHLPGDTSPYGLTSVVSLMPIFAVISYSDPVILIALQAVLVLLQRVLLDRATDHFQVFWREFSLRLEGKTLTVLLLNHYLRFDFEVLGWWAPKILRECEPLPSICRIVLSGWLLVWTVGLLMDHLRPWAKTLLLDAHLNCLEVWLEGSPNLAAEVLTVLLRLPLSSLDGLLRFRAWLLQERELWDDSLTSWVQRILPGRLEGRHRVLLLRFRFRKLGLLLG